MYRLRSLKKKSWTPGQETQLDSLYKQEIQANRQKIQISVLDISFKLQTIFVKQAPNLQNYNKNN